MSGRVVDNISPLWQEALYSGLDLAALGAMACCDPACVEQAVFQYTVEKRRTYLAEQKAKLNEKYHYLICQIRWITQYAHFSNTRATCGIPLQYRIECDEAIKWYHRSKWYYNNDMNLVMEAPHLLFMKKWLALHPDTNPVVLRRELALSDVAMQLIYAKRPNMPLHREFMEAMHGIEVDMPWDLIPTAEDLHDYHGDEQE